MANLVCCVCGEIIKRGIQGKLDSHGYCKSHMLELKKQIELLKPIIQRKKEKANERD